MWLEAVLTSDDLAALVVKMTPLSIRLGDEGAIRISDPTDVALVADVGLRMTCKAEVEWHALGIALPITLNSLAVILRPEILKTDTGEVLTFKLEIEHADFAGVPTLIDDGVTAMINKALAAKHIELLWNFTQTLSHTFALPSTLQPLESLALNVAWGKVKITSEALVLAISFHTAVARHGDKPIEPPAVHPLPPPAPAVSEPEGGWTRDAKNVALAVAAGLGAGLGAIAMGGAYALGRSLRTR